MFLCYTLFLFNGTCTIIHIIPHMSNTDLFKFRFFCCFCWTLTLEGGLQVDTQTDSLTADNVQTLNPSTNPNSLHSLTLWLAATQMGIHQAWGWRLSLGLGQPYQPLQSCTATSCCQWPCQTLVKSHYKDLILDWCFWNSSFFPQKCPWMNWGSISNKSK